MSKYVAASGEFVGWIGAVTGTTAPTGISCPSGTPSVGQFTPGWCKGGTSGAGTADGMMNDAGGVYVDPAGNLYVVDQLNGRINRYNSTTGAANGWIGNIKTTVGMSCVSGAPSVGQFTPSWCTGGSVQPSTAADGSLSVPTSLTGDGTYLYVSDYGTARVNKYLASTGAFVGWIGEVSSLVPSLSCLSGTPLSGSPTPGWCTGGQSGYGDFNGGMGATVGVALDASGTHLYVADTENFRVLKFNAGTGAFVGWIGQIGVSPTGGDTGCAGAQVGSTTPGWCTGGYAAPGTTSGAYTSPHGIAVDPAGNYLYISDEYNGRMTRFSPP